MTRNTHQQRPLAGFEPRNTSLLASFLLACLALGLSACGPVEFDDVRAARANVEDALLSVEFEITSPEQGAFRFPSPTSDNDVRVTGTVTGLPEEDVAISVNGVPASVSPDGDALTWEAVVPYSEGEPFRDLVAELVTPGGKMTDIVTIVIGGTVDSANLAPSTIGLRLTNAAFDKVEKIVTQYAADQIDAMMPAPGLELAFFNPEVEWYKQIEALYADYFVDTTIQEVSSSALSVNLEPGNGIIKATATVSDIFIRADVVVGETLLDTPGVDVPGAPCTLDISADELRVTAEFVLTSGEDSLLAIFQPRPDDESQQGGAVGDAIDVASTFSSGFCALPGIERALKDVFIPDLEKILEAQVAGLYLNLGQGNSIMKNAIESAFQELNFEEPVTLTAELNGQIIEDMNGLTYEAATAFYPNFGIEGCEPAAETPDPGASLKVDTQLPALRDTTAEMVVPYDFAVALSPTALNQFLRAQTACGQFPQRELGELDFGRGLEPMYAHLLDDYIPGFAEFADTHRFAMRLRPTLAPVVTGEPGPGGELLELRIAGYLLELYDPEDQSVLIAASISGEFGIDLSVADGKLDGTVSVPDEDDVTIQIYGGTMSALQTHFKALLPAIVAPFLDEIEARLGEFSVPVPENLGVEVVEISLVDGVPTVFLDMTVPVCGQDYDTGSDGVCYEACEDDFEGRNGTCWKDCPADFVDYDTMCYHDVEIIHKESRYRGAGSVPTCGSFEKDGQLCYPTCASGYDGEGPTCWKRCPSGYKDDGAFCRKDAVIISKTSYYRGSGKSMVCASSEEKYGGLCYPKCSSGYKGVGSRCYKNCASGYYDDGLTCRRNARSIKKSTSGCPWYNLCCASCPSGYRNDGCYCTRDARIYSKSSYYRGSGKTVRYCPSGTEKYGSLCYSKCNSGYKGVGTRCYKNCPSGYKDDGTTCRKDAIINAKYSYGRGAGTVPSTCSSSRELEDGLCYSKCASDENGAGVYCYKECASKYTDDGLFCRIDETIFVKDFYERDGFYPGVQ